MQAKIMEYILKLLPKTTLMKWVLGVAVVVVSAFLGIDAKEVQKSFCSDPLPVLKKPIGVYEPVPAPEVVRLPDVVGEFPE